jgi:hypothetical protein
LSKWSFAIALAVVSIAVSDAAAAGTRQLDSGIVGEVKIAPTCPVERPGRVCERAYQATVTIRREPTHALVARVQSSATGHFKIALAPGRYLLIPQNSRPYPRSSPVLTTVHSHRYTAVRITYDSGIR